METYGNIWNPPIFFSRQQLRNYHLTASPSSPGARSSSILPDVLGLGSSETWPETWPETSWKDGQMSIIKVDLWRWFILSMVIFFYFKTMYKYMSEVNTLKTCFPWASNSRQALTFFGTVNVDDWLVARLKNVCLRGVTCWSCPLNKQHTKKIWIVSNHPKDLSQLDWWS